MRHLEDASAHWRRGDKALANIRLAFAQIPRLERQSDAYRLFLAEELLDGGMSPGALMKVLGLDASPRKLEKYDPSQPRVPAGSGRTSGRWTSDGSGGAGSGATPNAPALGLLATGGPGTLAEGLFRAGPGVGRFLAALGSFAARLSGPGIVLGAIFIPSRNIVASEGVIAGAPDLSYSWNEDDGSLRLYRQDDSGRRIVSVARLGPHGIFYHDGTDLPIGRVVDGSVVIDTSSLDAAEGRRAGPDGDADEPKLCPDPTEDTPHGAKEHSKAYQEQISRLNNPQRPLSSEFAVSLFNPTLGKDIYFDDCRESDGAMIEAKGPGYADMLTRPFMEKILPEKWTKQAEQQVDAADWRDVEWYFAEPEPADKARKLFEDDPKLRKIKVFYVPAEPLK